MRILILSTFDTFGGAAIAATRLNKALVKSGVKSTLLVQDKKSKELYVEGITSNWFQKKLALFRFVFDRLQFIFFEKSKAYRFQFSQGTIGVDIHNHPLVQDADVIHLHWINFVFLSVNSIKKIIDLKKPVVITMHDMWYFTGGCHYSKDCTNYLHECGNCEPFLKNPTLEDLSHQGWLQKKSLFKNTQITFVACSEWLAAKARTSSLLNGADILAIPNPINANVFINSDKKEAQDFFKLSQDKKYVLFAAMKVSDERKGFEYFKQALNILKSMLSMDQNTIELLIFGQEDTSDFESITFKVNSLGRLTDVTTIAKAYAAAHVFVIPSIEDNLPNTVMESLSCGTPVVGFNTGGIPEMIEHKKTGYIATRKSPNDLAKGMYWTLFQSEYEKLCLTCREKVLSDYTENIVVNKYVQVYNTYLK
jgi:glycosyltransferase involved in cell wall biosynthesis